MRHAKQMLDDEDRAIAEGRVNISELRKAETDGSGRQIVRITPPQ